MVAGEGLEPTTFGLWLRPSCGNPKKSSVAVACPLDFFDRCASFCSLLPPPAVLATSPNEHARRTHILKPLVSRLFLNQKEKPPYWVVFFLSVLYKIDDIEKRRFYKVFQAFHCLESFFCSTVTTFAPDLSWLGFLFLQLS